MRYIRFIAAFIAIFATTSCFVDDIEQVEVPSEGRDDVTVVARVARFDDREVDTRGTKNDAEANVTCMAVAIFPIVEDANGDDVIGDCVFYDFRKGSQLLFTINRQEMKNGAYIYNVGKPYVMYVFANLPTMTEETCANKSLAEMKAMAYSVDGVKIPTDGFPMIGSLGDTITPEGDGKTFILKPGEPANPTLPLVNGNESDLLNVPMKAMFSKVNFTIKVTPDQTVDTHLTPQFELKGYTVNNVPASVDFTMGGGDRLNHKVVDNVTSVIGPFENPMPLLNDIKIARGTQTINFTFYLPERFLTPTYQSHDGSQDGQQGYYDYPFPVVSGKYRAEDLDLRQRFKPQLPEGQAATYVTINGTFRDHQQHEFNVTYDVYLGEDNYGNFDTERNCEYFHYVTIRGILNSDDQVNYDPEKEMPVSIDHRVNVERVDPIIINLRRETLLDSHFEVRPLRIRKNPGYTGDLSNAKVKVEVVYDKEPDQTWIGLERSFGNGVQSGSATHLAKYLVGTDLANDRKNSLGKRKYFTTDLTTNTLSKAIGTLDANGYSTTGGQSVIVPVTEEDEAVWIYVDEALVAEAGDAIRKATIRVSVAEDGTNYGAPIDYVMQQRQLFPVTYNNITYLIEYEEEYLHNFDADDSYGQTEYDGMEWGLEDTQLSYDHRAMYVEEKSFSILGIDFGSAFTGIVNNLLESSSPFYDFYLLGDTNLNVITHQYAGHEFCNEIIEVVSTTGDELNLSQKPRSAVEYCYNRNKRNADGTVASVNWYLPAIDEIEEIMMGAYSDFLVFQDQFYWSCQPAYDRVFVWYDNIITRKGEYMRDNKAYARATKANYMGNNQYEPIYSTMIDYSFYTEIEYSGSKWSVSQLLDNSKYSAPETPVPDGGITLGGNKVNKASVKSGYQPRTEKNRIRCVRYVPPVQQ